MKENIPHSPASMNRRDFVKASAIGAGLMTLPSFVAGQSATKPAPSNRLNIAIVGVAGKGKGPTIESYEEGHNVIALCDVDWGNVNRSLEPDKWNGDRFGKTLAALDAKGTKRYWDYREMLNDLGDAIDAVIVSTPDHMHYPIAMSALNKGCHVYCEKPLTHTVDEARKLAKRAKEKGLVTQMGNQGHSNNGTRLVREWVQAGVIGDIQEVHAWTDRPAVFWNQGVPKPDHSKFVPVVPEGLRWDLWQGVAEPRAYDPAYMPFNWRAYVDYGCGALGDMACHIMDAAFWALDLGSPTAIEATTTTMNGFSFPVSSVVSFDFPARNQMKPVNFKWYDGDLRPSIPNFLKDADVFNGEYHSNGSLLIGEKAAILCDLYGQRVQILPDAKFMELRPTLPERTIRRIKGGHLQEFFSAIAEDRPASSDFSYAGPFTETVLLGVIAQRTGRRLQFDGAAGKFNGDDDANKLIAKDYPKGWILS